MREELVLNPEDRAERFLFSIRESIFMFLDFCAVVGKRLFSGDIGPNVSRRN